MIAVLLHMILDSIDVGVALSMVLVYLADSARSFLALFPNSTHSTATSTHTPPSPQPLPRRHATTASALSAAAAAATANKNTTNKTASPAASTATAMGILEVPGRVRNSMNNLNSKCKRTPAVLCGIALTPKALNLEA